MTMLMGVPPVSLRDDFRANSLARGMNVGIALPWLISILWNGQNQGRPRRISMWPSSDCMQSRINDSRAQPNGCRQRKVRQGCRNSEPASVSSQSRMRSLPGLRP